MRDDKENIIVELSFEIALLIIEFSEILDEKKKHIISRHILRSGTSIGANVREAQNAESQADFIHKMKDAAKQADEIAYCLLLSQYSKNYPDTSLLQEKLNLIMRIVNKIIATTKQKGE